MGVFLQVFLPVASLRSVSVYPPGAYRDPTAPPVIPTSQNALENAVLTHSNGILSVPSFLEEWISSPKAVKKLSSFLYVVRTSPLVLHEAYIHACRYYQVVWWWTTCEEDRRLPRSRRSQTQGSIRLYGVWVIHFYHWYTRGCKALGMDPIWSKLEDQMGSFG